MNYGVWEDGRHVRYFDEAAVDDIKNQRLDFR